MFAIEFNHFDDFQGFSVNEDKLQKIVNFQDFC